MGITQVIVFACIFAVAWGAKLPKFAKPVPGPKIIGGTEIPIEAAPYAVQVQIGGRYSYGGVIVDKTHVLSSAYSTYYFKTGDLSIRAGSAIANEGGSIHYVEKIVYHKLYKINYEYNIVILTVDPPFEFDNTTKKIDLADEDPINGKFGTATGWGSTSSWDNIFPGHLLSADMRVISNAECSEATSTEFCAGERTYSSCVGDEGGPFVVGGKLAGVNSAAYKCGDLVPSTYTSVVQLKDFILENIA